MTEWVPDSFGQTKLAKRPDGTQTTIERTRTKGGGADKNAWRITQRTTTEGGADDTTEIDLFGRAVRVFTQAPDTAEMAGAPPRVMQVIAYDRLSGNVARRSVPTSEATPEAQLLFDVYEYDALAREVLHTTPWSATTTTTYLGLKVEVTDPLSNVTVTESDTLGRPVTITDAMKGTTGYTYGPFGALYTVTDPGGAVTRTTRDALERVWKLEEPNRGTTILVHDGFGELVSSTDALNRVITFGYDSDGRLTSRIDQKGLAVETSTWAWDTAAHGIGKLHVAASPDGTKTYAYTNHGQLAGFDLLSMGESEALHVGLTYDAAARLDTITYPTPSGEPVFAIRHEYDPHGFAVAVKDSATNEPYWRLTAVDSAGRYQKERFGNDATTERSYFPDKQAIKSIVTQSGATPVQDLRYDWDARLNLKSRTDALQPQFKTERFRHDPLERLTCAYFGANEDPVAPCALSYDYAPNGNLTFKSDVGVLTYGDPAHPHAVTAAGGTIYQYSAVGNQITRPGGALVSYTPFDLPRQISQGPTAVTFGYDADQARIRKTTPTEETLYVGGLYERVVEMASAKTEHRYYVSSPERVVAVVTRGGKAPGTEYVHVDHLGSVDALTNALGAVDERRSYDPFGGRRSPIWGQPPPASFNSRTTKGFTGHESDDELGLINMRGRLMDPKLGRFITTDPVVTNIFSGQRLNAYSYVMNRPLSLIDPSGFEPNEIHYEFPEVLIEASPEFRTGQAAKALAAHDRTTAQESGADAATTDVDVTGSQAGAALVARIPEPEEAAVARRATDSLPSASIEPRTTMLPSEQRAAWEAYDRATSPISSSLYYDFYLPAKAKFEDVPQVYLDSDHNPQVSVAHRDYSESMATVLGQIVLAVAPMLEPGAVVGAAAESESVNAGGSASGAAKAGTTTTLKPGPYARESIPAHRGRPTAQEQRQVNELMQKYGCHTCGTKSPGTRSGNAIADHQPAQALGEPSSFYPHCNGCKARQGGEVLQELRKTQEK